MGVSIILEPICRLHAQRIRYRRDFEDCSGRIDVHAEPVHTGSVDRVRIRVGGRDASDELTVVLTDADARYGANAK